MTPGAFTLVSLAAAILASPDVSRRFRDFSGRDRRMAVPFLEDLAEAVLFQLPGDHHAGGAYKVPGGAVPILAPDLVGSPMPPALVKGDPERTAALNQELAPQGLNSPPTPPRPAPSRPGPQGHPGALNRTAAAARQVRGEAPRKGGKP